MFVISGKVYKKLVQKHGLSEPEKAIAEAFANITGKILIDNREQHYSNPPTEWFIAETDRGVKLKVCFINKDGVFYIRTAYPANQTEIRIYEQYNRR